ncbi:MAG: tetratricopeptide repeat protein [Treponema sp.]|nr:tetratricopeptide repeat protein [Treponema sp.]
MKKLLLTLALSLAASLCFAQGKNYVNERYEKLDKEEQFESIIKEIEENSQAPYSASDYFYLGLANFRMEKDEEAQKYFGMAIQEDPDFVRPYYYLAGSFLYTEKYEDAILNYEKCIELDKTFLGSYQMLGMIYETQNDYQKALENYSKSYELKKTPESTYQMAYILYKLGDYKKALPYIESYLEYDNDSFSMTNLMILALYSTGEYEKAAKYEKQIRKIWENTSDESIKKKPFFIIYSFTHNDYEIDVYEKFDQSGNFYYPLTCNVCSNGKVIKTVNLEYDAVTEKFGTPYLLGMDEIESKTHYTMNIGFEAFPDFPVFIKYVKLILDGKVNVGASSTKVR